MNTSVDFESFIILVSLFCNNSLQSLGIKRLSIKGVYVVYNTFDNRNINDTGEP